MEELVCKYTTNKKTDEYLRRKERRTCYMLQVDGESTGSDSSKEKEPEGEPVYGSGRRALRGDKTPKSKVNLHGLGDETAYFSTQLLVF